MSENILDIAPTYNVLDDTLDRFNNPCLRLEIAEWCDEALGYCPKIEYVSDVYSFQYIHLVFRSPTDLILFKINFAHKWLPFR